MIIKINSRSEIPIYLQLRNQIVKGIGKGELEQGEILPTVRQMAADLGVNAMTVSKAYQAVESRRIYRDGSEKGQHCLYTGEKNIPRSRLLLRKNWRMSWSF